MRFTLPLLTVGVLLIASSLAEGQIQVRVFERREGCLQEPNREAALVYHWAVYRDHIRPRNVNFVGRQAFQITHGYIRADRYSQGRMRGTVRVNEFRGRPKDSGVLHTDVEHKLRIGPVWIAKRTTVYPLSTLYDLIDHESRDVFAPAAHFKWSKDDPPPPLNRYWADNNRPDWFNAKVYRLFVPQKKSAWWARTEAGQWDLIDKGELSEENGDGPKIPALKATFQGKY